jgi:uncharacterized membrane protein YhiD involved in acid resistance
MAKLSFSDLFATSNMSQGATLTVGDIIQGLLVTFLIAMFVYYIYKKTFTGVLYSKSFNVTLVAISMITAVIMMAISGNLALSLGMVGALSIVRFRTAIKDPKDIAFLFWAISLGIINGVAFYKLSIIASLFIGLVLVVLSKKIVIDNPYLLVLQHDNLDENIMNTILNKTCKKSYLRSKMATDSGNETTIEIKVKKNMEQPMMKALKNVPGVKKVMMFSYTGDLTE